jgi:hypothetical protein
MDSNENGGPPEKKPAASRRAHTLNYIAETHRRCSATRRLPWYGKCSCRDPWMCRCDEPAEPSARMVDAYASAASHLLAEGFTPAPCIPEMRVMWGKGRKPRDLARIIASRWEAVA